MDVEPGMAPVAQPPDRTGRGVRLVARGLATVLLIGSIIGVALFVLMFFASTSNDFLAPDMGWQVWVMLAVIAVAAVGVAAGAVVVDARARRALAGRTRHQRLPVLIAILPGLVLAGLATGPMQIAVTWASDHTAQAQSEQTAWARWQAEYRQAPIVIRSNDPAAPPSVAALLLGRTEIGPQWYDTVSPDPAMPPVRTQDRAQGVVRWAQVDLVQTHWTGKAWAEGTYLIETVHVVGTTSQARDYLATLSRTSGACGCAKETYGPVTRHQVNRVAVWERNGTDLGAYFQAYFAVGTNVYAVNFVAFSVPSETLAGTFGALLTRAVNHARQGDGAPPAR
jgi:MFS family permease